MTGVRAPKTRAATRATAPPGTTAIVLGGGLAGIAAATVLAERGVRVTLVERERYLGGRAGAWSDRLSDGTPFEMERGFHAFFRHYHNLRALLRRVDPTLSCLSALPDYPLLGPSGARESFADLPRRAPFNVIALVRRTPSMRLTDLLSIDVRRALEMARFDMRRTYERFDHAAARDYLDSLRFPERARRMLFDVFSHSFFNPEEDFSAAELLMMFHTYFLGNPEGLVFDVVREPTSVALFEPLRTHLERLGGRVLTGTAATHVDRGRGIRVHVSASSELLTADAAVLALPVPALRALVAASPTLCDPMWRRGVEALGVTRPFVVLRLWLDRPCSPSRSVFAGTTGLGLLDNVSLYDRFQGESRRWAERTSGSVVELHAYAVEPGVGADAVRAELIRRLHEIYPETRAARIVEERLLERQDCPAFPPGSHGGRPEVATPFPEIALAGDFVRLPFPSALMERAVSSGFCAANHVLGVWGVEEEPLWSVPPRGLLAGVRC